MFSSISDLVFTLHCIWNNAEASGRYGSLLGSFVVVTAMNNLICKFFLTTVSEPSTDLDWRSHDIEKQITLIASQNITKNIELLQMLEAR